MFSAALYKITKLHPLQRRNSGGCPVWQVGYRKYNKPGYNSFRTIKDWSVPRTNIYKFTPHEWTDNAFKK